VSLQSFAPQPGLLQQTSQLVTGLAELTLRQPVILEKAILWLIPYADQSSDNTKGLRFFLSLFCFQKKSSPKPKTLF
jgi:hypothetical protein